MVLAVFAAGPRVLAQDDARPVQRAQQQPMGLGALPLGGLHLDAAPLQPHASGGQGGDQCHGEHGHQQGRALLMRNPWGRAMLVDMPITGHGGMAWVTACAAEWVHHERPTLQLGRTQSMVMLPRPLSGAS